MYIQEYLLGIQGTSYSIFISFLFIPKTKCACYDMIMID